MALVSKSNSLLKFRTHRESVRFTLEWTIEHFETLREETEFMYNGAGVTMADLGLKDDYKGLWRMRVQPCLKHIDVGIEEKFVSLELQLDTDEYQVMRRCSDGQTIPVQFSGRVTTGKTDPSVIWEDNNDTRVLAFSAAGDERGWTEAVSHDILFGSRHKPGLLKDDCITVSMDVVVYKPARSSQLPQTVVHNAGNDYQDLATRQLNWFTAQPQRPSATLDFTLQSSYGKEFHTSRWILMAHSPVFAAMLKGDSVEATQGRCTMVDVDGETTEIMLHYLYGCSLQKINQGNVEKVLLMADKYALMNLLHTCEERLVSTLTVDTAVHLLIVANQRGLEKLQAAALNAIPKTMATVLKNVAPEDVQQLDADPDLLQMIMEHCSKKMRLDDGA